MICWEILWELSEKFYVRIVRNLWASYIQSNSWSIKERKKKQINRENGKNMAQERIRIQIVKMLLKLFLKGPQNPGKEEGKTLQNFNKNRWFIKFLVSCSFVQVIAELLLNQV